MKLPKYTLGTWLMGGNKEPNPNNDDKKDLNTIRMHLDYGIKSIFTAQNYAKGKAEEIVGEAINRFDRSEIVLSTAVNKHNSKYDDALISFADSLERLQTNYIDILYHHATIPEIPIKETMKAFNKLYRDKQVKALAVSNYSVDQLKEALEYAESPIIANQVYYNLFHREPEISKLLDFCKKEKITLQAFRTLELGLFHLLDKYPMVRDLCEKYSLTPTQLAISWLTSQDNIAVVVTTTQYDHMKENVKAMEVVLEKEDVEVLRERFPVQVY